MSCEESPILELRREESQSLGSDFAVSDPGMFKTLDAGRASNVTVEELAGHFGASVDDFGLKDGFDLSVLRRLDYRPCTNSNGQV